MQSHFFWRFDCIWTNRPSYCNFLQPNTTVQNRVSPLLKFWKCRIAAHPVCSLAWTTVVAIVCNYMVAVNYHLQNWELREWKNMKNIILHGTLHDHFWNLCRNVENSSLRIMWWAMVGFSLVEKWLRSHLCLLYFAQSKCIVCEFTSLMCKLSQIVCSFKSKQCGPTEETKVEWLKS